jgi:hypothetical protein
MGEKHLLMLFVVATRLSMLDQPAGESELEHEVGEAAGETGHDHDAVMGRT